VDQETREMFEKVLGILEILETDVGALKKDVSALKTDIKPWFPEKIIPTQVFQLK